MTTTTALSITRAARIGADLIDIWTGPNNNLPMPGSMSARIDYSTERGHHEGLLFMFYGDTAFEDVRRWARAMTVDAVERSTEVNDFIDAEVVRNGVTLRLSTNREHVHAPLPGTREQVCAEDEVANCACGKRIIQHEVFGLGLCPWKAV